MIYIGQKDAPKRISVDISTGYVVAIIPASTFPEPDIRKEWSIIDVSLAFHGIAEHLLYNATPSAVISLFCGSRADIRRQLYTSRPTVSCWTNNRREMALHKRALALWVLGFHQDGLIWKFRT